LVLSGDGDDPGYHLRLWLGGAFLQVVVDGFLAYEVWYILTYLKPPWE